MSRNMIEANIEIFSILKEFVNQSEVSSPYPLDATRYIKTDKIEKKWLKELIIKETYALPTLRFVTFTFEDTDYFATIINDSPRDSIELLRDVKQSLDGVREGNLGYRFYQIRNSIVHFRPSTKVFSIDDENWNKLIKATLKIIRHWYDFFGSKLG